MNKMTLIIYLRCNDAQIVALDRQESDSSGVGEFAKKYYIPDNREFIFALAGDSLRIATIVDKLYNDQSVTAATVRKKLAAITEKPFTTGNSDVEASGLLLVKSHNCFKFHNVWFSNSNSAIEPQDGIPLKCYGGGKDLATYLIRKLDLPNLPCITACQHLAAIINDVAERTPSVGNLKDYGIDLIVLTNEGKLWNRTIYDSTGIGEIGCSYNMGNELNPALSPLKSVLEGDNAAKDGNVHTTESDHYDDSDMLVSIQTDRGVYLYGSEMIVTVINPHFASDETMTITVTDVAKDVVYRRTMPVSKGANGNYQENIKIQGKDWAKPNSKFKINVKCMDKEASCYVLVDVKTSIELDQEVYSWTDKAYITATLPSLIDSETVGNTNSVKCCFVAISTSAGVLERYKLVETEANTGIFAGEVRLTGFPDYDFYECKALVGGETGGAGPTSGKIGCANKDLLHVTLVTGTSMVSSSALIKWNMGEVQWLRGAYSISEKATLQVIDQDMNLDPEQKDEFLVRVRSDSDRNGIDIKVVETGNATGIFNGVVTFTTEEQSSSPKLRVSRGDTVTAEYDDCTLPDPKGVGSKLTISGTCVVGYVPPPPLQQVSARNLRLLDSLGNVIEKVRVHQDIRIAAELTNLQDIKQRFAYLVRITDTNGIPALHDHDGGLLSPGQTVTSSVSWVPDNSGLYTITVFVWKSIGDPHALSIPLKLQIAVEDSIAQNLPRKTSVEPSRELKNPLVHTVHIPLRSSSSECEKNDACYIPSKLFVGVNDIVVWINADIALHTVTSGTVNQGSDGNFDSKLLVVGASFAHRFTRKGAYPYFCPLHPWQKGVIVVQ